MRACFLISLIVGAFGLPIGSPSAVGLQSVPRRRRYIAGHHVMKGTKVSFFGQPPGEGPGPWADDHSLSWKGQHPSGSVLAKHGPCARVGD